MEHDLGTGEEVGPQVFTCTILCAGFNCIPDYIFLETRLYFLNTFSLSCFDLGFWHSKRSYNGWNEHDPGIAFFPKTSLSISQKGARMLFCLQIVSQRANGLCDYGQHRVLQRLVSSATALPTYGRETYCVRPSVTKLEDCAGTDSKPTSL